MLPCRKNRKTWQRSGGSLTAERGDWRESAAEGCCQATLELRLTRSRDELHHNTLQGNKKWKRARKEGVFLPVTAVSPGFLTCAREQRPEILSEDSAPGPSLSFSFFLCLIRVQPTAQRCQSWRLVLIIAVVASWSEPKEETSRNN